MEESEIELKYGDRFYISEGEENLTIEITDESGIYISKGYVTVEQAEEMVKALQEKIDLLKKGRRKVGKRRK
ncbi:hypothetical protein [Enterococcus phage TJE4]|uniref:Uncharacterized protein n=1 Tax=Enterococcus phage 9183 TaxID=2763102 RepID=A0A7L7SM24_9CAUD|nr:hypothetical protein KNV65_gp010 [Enterococcus phage 9183]QOC57503.1 hypothetical protein phi9183_ORF010 [Enterococcus phage 9183]UVD42874.1 hypothetical protein [Enterococcus phage TJE4]